MEYVSQREARYQEVLATNNAEVISSRCIRLHARFEMGFRLIPSYIEEFLHLVSFKMVLSFISSSDFYCLVPLYSFYITPVVYSKSCASTSFKRLSVLHSLRYMKRTVP